MIKVHTFTSSPGEIDTNSFLIETDKQVLAIDAQFLATPARQMRWLLDSLGKPLAGLLITHPHPDHFNGVDVFLDGLADIPIMATQATLEGIHKCAVPIREKWRPMYGDEYPEITRFPDTIIPPNHMIEQDGVEIIVESLGVGEAPDASILNIPASGDLILSDVLYVKTHAWIVEQHSREWVAQLEYIKRTYPEKLQDRGLVEMPFWRTLERDLHVSSCPFVISVHEADAAIRLLGAVLRQAKD